MPGDLPPAPTVEAALPYPVEEVALALPVYLLPAGSSWLRAWLTNKLNAVVRGVHQAKLLAFERARARVQEDYDAVALKNARSEIDYRCALESWKIVRAEVATERRAAFDAFQERATKARELYRSRKNQYDAQIAEAALRLAAFWQRVTDREPSAIKELFDIALSRIVTPLAFSRELVCAYDSEQG